MLQMVALGVGLLYKVPKWLLWRGQHWLRGNHCCYGEINSVRKLYNYTT
jgi:hypothetical protein